MIRKVHIAPVGFEFDRIIEGVVHHPCNVIYFLKSYKELTSEADPDKEMIEIAKRYVDNLEAHFINSRICTPIVIETLLIQLEPIIEELCRIISKEINEYHADEIWINVSTSTKLFVSAAMYVGSFKHELVKLFYIDASHYTVNDLFNPEIKKKEIREKFEKYGITYKENEESYRNIDVPVYPTEVLTEQKKDILKALRKLTHGDVGEMITFMNLLKELGQDPYDKTIKMKYGHHIRALKARNFMIEKTHGRQKKFGLTHEGQILGLILTYFG